MNMTYQQCFFCFCFQKEEKDWNQPVIIFDGDLLSSPSFRIVAEHVDIAICSSVLEAVGTAFACHYVFDMHYNRHIATTMKFIGGVLLGLENVANKVSVRVERLVKQLRALNE